MGPDDSMSTHSNISIAVAGFGYVGLAFGQVLPTLGDDISTRRVAARRRGGDRSGKMGAAAFSEAALHAAGFQAWRL